MADITPTGPLAVSVDALRTLIANVPYFQTWTGTADAAHALLRVFTADINVQIASVAIVAGVLTISTVTPHAFLAGSTVLVAGAELGAQSGVNIDGALTVASVTSNTLAVTTGLPDVAAFNPRECYIANGPRPLAIICETDEGLRGKSIGTGGASVFSGEIEILFEADVSGTYANDARNAIYEARNAYGQLVQGIQETQDTGDLMVLNEVTPVSGPEFTSAVSQDDNAVRYERWRALVRVGWGVAG